MNVKVELQGLLQAVATLNGAGEEVFRRWTKTTNRVLLNSLEYLRVTFRTTRSATSTGIVTGLLRRSYATDVKRLGHTLEGRLGILSASGNVLKYAPVHEFGATYASRSYGGRPSLAPTAQVTVPHLEAELLSDIRDVVKRAA